MELGLTIDLVLFSLFSLFTTLLVVLSIYEARHEKKIREDKLRKIKKVA